ncbi:hypothetical protein [Streptomyces zagrosensis]|uniref:Uncharacterized protein n=1 Tax=Streptomyces zagrosensis TaxID=1042984 RepID=A0A7W9QH66_9ACTN|nr:hypothetical protein [Streptomyces zagrosensis]MBB5939874.1 hypothetical protein [Streptomyces zagrosensis]
MSNSYRSKERVEGYRWLNHSDDEEGEGTHDEKDVDQGSQAPHGVGRVIRKVLPWLVFLALVVFVVYAVAWFIDFNNDLEHPEGNFDDWQCDPDYGTCGPSG